MIPNHSFCVSRLLARLCCEGYEVRSLIQGPPSTEVVLTLSSSDRMGEKDEIAEHWSGQVGARSFTGAENIGGGGHGVRWDVQECEHLLDTYSRVYHGLHLQLKELDSSIVSCKQLTRLHLKVAAAAAACVSLSWRAPLSRAPASSFACDGLCHPLRNRVSLVPFNTPGAPQQDCRSRHALRTSKLHHWRGLPCKHFLGAKPQQRLASNRYPAILHLTCDALLHS